MILTRIAINRPVTTAILFIALSFLGAISWMKLPIKLLPNITSPQLTIQVTMPGAFPEQVEREVIIPVEGEISKIQHIERISSVVRNGGGSITAEFKLKANMKFVALKLDQKIAALTSTLPVGARVYVGRNFDTEMFSNALMDLSVRGEGDVNRLRRIAEDKIRPELEKIDGVVNVGISGGQLREVQIDIDEYKAREYGVNLAELIGRINSFNRPKEYLGKVKSKNNLIYVTLSGQVTKISELENLIVNPDIPLKLKDIATIRLGRQNENRIYRVNGKSSVGIFILKDNESNLLDTSERTLKEIEKMNKVLEAEGIQIAVNFSAADFMGDAIFQVEKLAVLGALLALLVLLFFLRSAKTVSAILISIPVSLLITFNLMYYWGVSINLLSLVGLAIAIGMLVDNSIVVLENIYRHFEQGKDAKTASLLGCTEVTKAIVASTLTTIVIFIPVLFMEGMYRVILLEILLAIAFPLLVSLFVAFTLIPMFASQVLMRQSHRERSKEARQGLINRWQKSRVMEIFTVLLKSRLRSPGWTIVMMLILFMVSPLLTIPFLYNFGGVEEETNLPIYIETPPGTGLAATDFLTRMVEELADSIDFVKEIRSNILPENSNITVEFLTKEERDNALLNLDNVKRDLEDKVDEIRKLVDGSKITFESNTGGGRTGTGSGEMSGGGGGGPLAALFGSGSESIIIKGHDKESMKNLVGDITQRLRSFPEINRNSIRSNLRPGAEEIQVWGNQASLAEYNMTLQTLMQLISSVRRQGMQMTTRMKDEEGDILIRTRVVEKRERTYDDLREMSVPVPGVGEVPIRNLSDIIIDEGPRTIRRVDQERQSEINYTINDNFVQTQQDKDLLLTRIDQAVLDLRFPPGFTVEIVRDEDSLFSTISTRFLIALGLMYIILASTFESFKYPIVIFASIPMAIIGSLWFMLITHTPLHIFAFISYLVLLGIVVNNGIILIDYISILREKSGFSRERALIYATRARVRPILMTSITTMLGVVPLAIWPGTASELWKPFAISLIGGLGFATLLSLVYLPVLYVGIDEFIQGMKKHGFAGVLVVLSLNIGLISFVWFYWLESLLYRISLSVMLLTILNAIVWNFYNYLDRRKRKVEFEEEITITIRNLTKIYNEPGRFARDWAKRKRKLSNIGSNGKSRIEKSAIIESLIWKIPLLLFFAFMHYSYFQNTFTSGYWLLWLSVASLFLLFNTLQTLKDSLDILRRKDELESGRKKFPGLKVLSKLTVVVLMFVYLRNMGVFSTGWTITFGLIWLLFWYAHSVTKKVIKGDIVIEKIEGRFQKTRKRFYRAILKIPVFKRKKVQVRALHGVNLTIKSGMFGLLGPNGAGKSTLMRLISNLVYQSRGVVYFNDYKLSDFRDYIQKFIGYLPQIFGLHGDFTAWNYLNYIAILNRWGNKKERHELVESVLRNVNLWDRKDNKIKTFSGGMKQRIGVAQALLYLPKVIVVDEPTSGLDPRERIRFRNMLAEMSKNRIVIFSTHIVEDISTSCREVAVLNKGSVIFNGSPETMRLKAEGKVWESIIPEDEFRKWNRELQIVTHIRDKDGIKIKYIGSEPANRLKANAVQPTLEDAYLLILNPG